MSRFNYYPQLTVSPSSDDTVLIYDQSDGNIKQVPMANMPGEAIDGALTFVGTWDASVNTPTITSGVGVLGNYYIVSESGSISIDGESSWGKKDIILFDGTSWVKLEDTSPYQDAEASADESRNWAIYPEDSLVPEGDGVNDYSALHHAIKAGEAEAKVAPYYSDIDTVSTNINSVQAIATNTTNIETVATDIANINTTATNITDVNTVATDIANVNTTATNITDVNTVATDLNLVESNIETVATDIANINTTATNITDVNTVATDLNLVESNIETVATDITNINTTATNITDVNTVATDLNLVESNIETVATDIANINTTATNITDVNTVATDIANINTTATNITDVNTVATDLNLVESNIETVATDIANINTTATNITDVNTVATDLNLVESNIETVATDIANINTTATNITDVNTVATDITNINTTATNITDVNTVATDLNLVESNIETVATDIANINTTATNITDVNTVATDLNLVESNIETVATDIANINTTATNITDVNTVATDIANINTTAANIVDIQNANSNATESYHWAQYPENSLVPEGDGSTEYSAYHWAQKAQSAATGSLVYQGSWDASTEIYPGNPKLGDYYKVSAPGTIGGVDYYTGDSIIYNGVGWDHIDNTEQVTSVVGKVGAVILDANDISETTTRKWLSDTGKTKLDGIEEGATADQTKVDIDALGIDAATVNSLSVETAVPLGAVFTDTTYNNVSEFTNDAGYLTSETVTSLSLTTNTLTYVDENGTSHNIDLSLYLDDTNLARLTSGTLDGSTGIATFTRDDATTFTVDMSALLDDTTVTVEDSLTSISTVDALSANQGKQLNDNKVDNSRVLTDVPSGAVFTDTTYSNVSEFTNDAGYLTSEADPVFSASEAANFVAGDKSKLNGIESGAEVNNISDINATDLTDAGDTSLHYHSADRNRSNHTGTQLASTISDFDTSVQAAETVTSLSLATNILTYVDENGTTHDIDLSLYLDDTNLARLTSGTLDGGTGIATFTRDDASTFTVDFSALLDDTTVTVEDTLTSTSTTNALSANQGKQLNDNKVDNSRVLTDVPTDAVFTDTVYTHPISHPASIITQDTNNRFVTDAEKSTWNAKSDFDGAYSSLTGKPTLGTAAATDATDYATAAQGEKADSALQSYTETDPIFTASEAANFTTGDKAKLDGVESGATADQTKLDIDALNIDSATVNGKTVETSVPAGAVFTDTTYSNISEFTNDTGYITDITNKSIQDLSDVSSSNTPSNADLLVYSTTNGWEPQGVELGISTGKSIAMSIIFG